ncbi:MAG: hypothetical protein RIR15_403 [Actinomycetota bacterium]
MSSTPNKQIAVNDIGSAEDFLAAVEKTLKFFNDGDLIEGTVVKIAVEEGAKVEVGDLIIVLEAMKMEQPLTAHKAGVISNLTAVIGATVSSGTNLCDIIDA